MSFGVFSYHKRKLYRFKSWRKLQSHRSDPWFHFSRRLILQQKFIFGFHFSELVGWWRIHNWCFLDSGKTEKSLQKLVSCKRLQFQLIVWDVFCIIFPHLVGLKTFWSNQHSTVELFNLPFFGNKTSFLNKTLALFLRFFLICSVINKASTFTVWGVHFMFQLWY